MRGETVKLISSLKFLVCNFKRGQVVYFNLNNIYVWFTFQSALSLCKLFHWQSLYRLAKDLNVLMRLSSSNFITGYLPLVMYSGTRLLRHRFMWHPAYNVRCFVVPINSSLLTIIMRHERAEYFVSLQMSVVIIGQQIRNTWKVLKCGAG